MVLDMVRYDDENKKIFYVSGLFSLSNYMKTLQGNKKNCKQEEETNHSKDIGLTDGDLLYIMYQLIEFVNQLSKVNIFHNDIKPDNIVLVCDELNHLFIKLIDFGVSSDDWINYYGFTRRYFINERRIRARNFEYEFKSKQERISAELFTVGQTMASILLYDLDNKQDLSVE